MKRPLARLDGHKYVLRDAWDDSLLLLRAGHRVGLPRARRAVCENRSVVAPNRGGGQVANGAVDVALAALRRVGMVGHDLFLLVSAELALHGALQVEAEFAAAVVGGRLLCGRAVQVFVSLGSGFIVTAATTEGQQLQARAVQALNAVGIVRPQRGSIMAVARHAVHSGTNAHIDTQGLRLSLGIHGEGFCGNRVSTDMAPLVVVTWQ
mmetsp:Transcript_7973/g.17406  ORF Transcript_7973/g.17406 Transcript_7973/m.17406 type:complete len:208 (+) Transcript_7973:1191-1814(+)